MKIHIQEQEQQDLKIGVSDETQKEIEKRGFLLSENQRIIYLEENQG